MTTPHRATPDQWANVERFVEECGYDACLLELRDRLSAAEQRIGELEGNHPAKPDSSAPAVNRRPLQEPSAAIIAECGGPCEQGFWHCDCGLLEELNPELRPAPAAPAGSLVEVVMDALEAHHVVGAIAGDALRQWLTSLEDVAAPAPTPVAHATAPGSFDPLAHLDESDPNHQTRTII